MGEGLNMTSTDLWPVKGRLLNITLKIKEAATLKFAMGGFWHKWGKMYKGFQEMRKVLDDFSSMALVTAF